MAIGTAILLSGVLCLSWRLSPEPGPPPTTPLTANPFATSPAFELFTDECRDDSETPDVHPQRKRMLSEVEVEGLKDLLGEIEEEPSIIDEEEDSEFEDDPVQRV